MTRVALAVLVAAGSLVASTRADAQTVSAPGAASTPAAAEQKPRWEFLSPAGTLVPVASQRNAIKKSNVIAFQASYVIRPRVAITATAGWGRSRDVAVAGAPKLDVFTYDLGAEVRAPQWKAGKVIAFSPFAGVGAGARSYNYRDLPIDATHNVAGYVSVGGEVRFRRVRMRVEVRDYVTGFRPLDGQGAVRARNDVVVMTGLRFARR